MVALLGHHQSRRLFDDFQRRVAVALAKHARMADQGASGPHVVELEKRFGVAAVVSLGPRFPEPGTTPDPGRSGRRTRASSIRNTAAASRLGGPSSSRRPCVSARRAASRSIRRPCSSSQMRRSLSAAGSAATAAGGRSSPNWAMAFERALPHRFRLDQIHEAGRAEPGVHFLVLVGLSGGGLQRRLRPPVRRLRPPATPARRPGRRRRSARGC